MLVGLANVGVFPVTDHLPSHSPSALALDLKAMYVTCHMSYIASYHRLLDS